MGDARGVVVPPWEEGFGVAVVGGAGRRPDLQGGDGLGFGLELGVCAEHGFGAVEGVVEHLVLLERELVFAGVVLGDPVE